jgi:hypothetical protein
MQSCLMHAAHAPCWTAAFLQVTAVGAGLLLGSALCIILPEGFEAAIQVLCWGYSGTRSTVVWFPPKHHWWHQQQHEATS